MKQYFKAILFLVTSILLSFVVIGVQAANKCLDLVRKVELSSNEAAVISNLEKGDYKTSVQRIRVAGKVRLVVIVGERHIKTPEDADRFSKVLEQFKFHGLEGIDLSNYWMPKTLSKVLDHKKSGSMTEGSSIHATALASFRNEVFNLIVEKMASEIVSGERSKESLFEEIDNGEFLKKTQKAIDIEADAGTKLVMQEIFKHFEVSELKTLIDQRLSQLRDSEKTAIASVPAAAPKNDQNEIKTFGLESGYNPSFREKIQGAMVSIAYKMAPRKVCFASGCAVALMSLLMTRDFEFSAIAGTWGYVIPSAGSAILSLAGRGFTGVENRNAFMIKSLMSVLSENMEIDKIVVTVGMSHVPGMVEILNRNGSATDLLNKPEYLTPRDWADDSRLQHNK